jgi:hypothetical protein
MVSAAFVVTSMVTAPRQALVVSVVTAVLIASLWFGLPLSRRGRDRELARRR